MIHVTTAQARARLYPLVKDVGAGGDCVSVSPRQGDAVVIMSHATYNRVVAGLAGDAVAAKAALKTLTRA